MDKSLSDTSINLIGSEPKTPPNYIFQRTKRNREDMEDSISNQLDEFKLEIRKMFTIFSDRHSNELRQMTTALKELQQSNLNVENSIAYLTAQNEELKCKITQLEQQSKEDKKHIAVLENKVEDMLMGGRKTNFVIKNVPRRNSENKEDLLEMIMCLSRSLNINVSKYDVKDIYRVRGKNSSQQNTPIIVETGSTLLRTEILKLGKSFNIRNKTKLCCKHLGFKTLEDTPIFLSEHLTPKGSRLHFLARDLTKAGTYKFCWTAYGKVYVKKDETSPTINITCEEQLHQLQLKI